MLMSFVGHTHVLEWHMIRNFLGADLTTSRMYRESSGGNGDRFAFYRSSDDFTGHLEAGAICSFVWIQTTLSVSVIFYLFIDILFRDKATSRKHWTETFVIKRNSWKLYSFYVRIMHNFFDTNSTFKN